MQEEQASASYKIYLNLYANLRIVISKFDKVSGQYLKFGMNCFLTENSK